MVEKTPVLSAAAERRARAAASERRTYERDLWASTPHTALHNPWMDPVDITAELEAIAASIDAGGYDVIEDVEGTRP